MMTRQGPMTGQLPHWPPAVLPRNPFLCSRQQVPLAVVFRIRIHHFGVLDFGFFDDRDIGVGTFP